MSQIQCPFRAVEVDLFNPMTALCGSGYVYSEESQKGGGSPGLEKSPLVFSYDSATAGATIPRPYSLQCG